MKYYQYLIIGGGMAGDAAVRGIRELDKAGAIGMLSKEPDPPYTRPNLSKALWKGRPLERIWRNTQDMDIDLILERKATHLDIKNKTVTDQCGDKYTYERLLLATGGTPIRLPFNGDTILYFRSLEDYRRLRSLSETVERFLVIGGGFIGTEIAAALTQIGKQVSMVFLEDAIGANLFPPDLAHFLNDYYRQKGVQVYPNDSVESVERKPDHISARSRNGQVFEVDGVVAGIGIRPNQVLAQTAGLQVENGVLVNEFMQTSEADIYAAGDLANFFHAALGKRVRVEHEDAALSMGRAAGRNMAGADEPYRHTPMFYSDLFDLGYEAVGEISSKLETVADWKEPFQQGTVYYLENQRVRGVLLWNTWEKVAAARALLAEPGAVEAEDLKGRIT